MTTTTSWFQQPQQQTNKLKPSRICRVCLSIVEESKEINTVEHSTGFMPYRDKLALVVPEMMLDMIQDPAICIECSDELQQAYKFKQKCMQTEEKIRRLVQSYGGVIYSLDLSNIADRSKLKQKNSETLLVAQPPPSSASSKALKFPPAVLLKVTQQQPQVIKKKEDKVEEKVVVKKNVIKTEVALPVETIVDETVAKPSVSGSQKVIDVEDEIEFHAVDVMETKNPVEESLLIPQTEETVEEQSDPLGGVNAPAPATPDKVLILK